MAEQAGLYKAEGIDTLAREYADTECGEQIGPKCVAKWHDLALRLSDGNCVGF